MLLPINLNPIPVAGSVDHRQLQRDTAVERARQRREEERRQRRMRPPLLTPVQSSGVATDTAEQMPSPPAKAVLVLAGRTYVHLGLLAFGPIAGRARALPLRPPVSMRAEIFP